MRYTGKDDRRQHHQTRLGGAGVRRLPSLRQYGARQSIPDHLPSGRYVGGVCDFETSGRRPRPHHPRSRPLGHGPLRRTLAGAGRHRRTARRGRRFVKPVIIRRPRRRASRTAWPFCATSSNRPTARPGAARARSMANPAPFTFDSYHSTHWGTLTQLRGGAPHEVHWQGRQTPPLAVQRL